MMFLTTKPDFDIALKRMEAWWQCQIVDRPPVSLYVRPSKPINLPTKSYTSHRDRWMDIDHILQCMQAQVQATPWIGETFPCFCPNLGPEICATLFGCELEFSATTSWSKPVAHSIRDILQLKPNLDNPYWNWIRQATRKSLQLGQDQWITGITDLHTNGDLLASLRDPQELCLDVADDPHGVARACEHITDSFNLLYRDLYDPIAAAGQPATSWLPFLHQGPAYVPSCDFICMISTPDFRHTILPSIRREIDQLQRSIFHLDGPGALHHLNDLLEIPNLNAIQWVYGAGHGPAANWIPVYQRIQAAGKAMEIFAENMQDARTVAAHLKPQGVWFYVGGSYTLQEAQDFLDWSARWAAQRE